MKTKVEPSVIPIYIAAGCWPVFGLFIKPHTIVGLGALAVLSAAGYFVGKHFFPGKEIEVEEVLKTGDQSIDEMIAESKKSLEELRKINAAIPNEKITYELNRMDKAGQEILKAVAQKPERATQVRRFMQYYLPMAAKLLNQYKTLHTVGVQGENIDKAMHSVENSLDLIAVAFEKQLDVLYRDEALDMTTDVSVLETMMKSDGLTDENLKNILKEETSNG